MSPKRADTGPAMPGAVWLRERRPTRNRGSLTRERIATEAVAMLDRDGVAKLSLRRLAQVLDVHATSLYWHVANRDDLLDLTLDAVFGELDLPRSHAPSWTDDVADFMHGLRRALLRHPWAGALASSRPLVGPNALARSEFVYTALTRAGLRGAELSAAAAAISNYVIGSVSAEAAWAHDGEDFARQAVNDHLRRHADIYPTLATHGPTLDSDWDFHFTRGATFLLDGLTPRGTEDRIGARPLRSE